MDLKASGALGGKSGLQQTASEEKRRRTELLRRLAEGSMTEEDRQKALEELGLQNASPEELDAYLKQQANASLEGGNGGLQRTASEEKRHKTELLRQWRLATDCLGGEAAQD